MSTGEPNDLHGGSVAISNDSFQGNRRMTSLRDAMTDSRASRVSRDATARACALLAALLAMLGLAATPAHAQGSFEFDFIVGGDPGDIQAFVDELETAVNLPISFVQSWPLFGLEEYRVTGDSGLGSQGAIETAIDNAVAAGLLSTGGLDIEFRAETGSGQTGSIWVTCVCTPEDFETQYGLGLIQAAAAREHATGRGVLVGIIDSGLVPGVPVTEAASTGRGWTWIRPPGYTGALPYLSTSLAPGDFGDGQDNDQDGVVDEGVGHGTFIASLVTLVAPEARHMHYRVLDGEGACFMSEVVSALQQAILDGMHVVNLSIVPSQPTAVMVPAFRKAFERGTTVLVSSGNFGTPGVPSQNPYICTNAPTPVCSAPYIVQVGATDWNDARWDNSDWGDWVDVHAPGVTYLNIGGDPSDADKRLVAPIGLDPLDPTNVRYVTASGTSFATAFATGAAACFRSTRGDWPNAEVPLSDIAPRIAAALRSSSEESTTSPPGVRRVAAYDLVSAQPRNRLRAPDLVDSGEKVYRRCIDGADQAALLGNWGAPPPGVLRLADLDYDGIVGGFELGLVLSSWGCADP